MPPPLPSSQTNAASSSTLLVDKKVFTILICMSMGLLFADQNLLSPNLSLIATEFGFNDEERDEKLGGEIALGFFMVGGIVSIFIGYLADTMNRVHLFCLVILVGEVSCLFTYFSRTYAQLLYSRILTGISIGGASPVVFSMLGDMYSGETRIFISACYGISVSIGIASGQLLSGWMGHKYGWRSPFLVIAFPAIILATFIFFLAVEPRRGDKELAYDAYLHDKEKERLSVDVGNSNSCSSNNNSINSCSIENNSNSNSNNTNFGGMGGGGSSGNGLSPVHANGDIETFIIKQVDAGNTLSERTTTGSKDEYDRDISSGLGNNNNNNNIGMMKKEMSSIDLIAASSATSIAAAAVVADHKVNINKCTQLLQSRTVILCYLQGIPGCMTWSIISVFLCDYLSNDLGYSIQQATIFMTCLGIGSFCGQMFGGWVGQMIYNNYRRFLGPFMGLSIISAIVPIQMIINSGKNMAVASTTSLLSSSSTSSSSSAVAAIVSATTTSSVVGLGGSIVASSSSTTMHPVVAAVGSVVGSAMSVVASSSTSSTTQAASDIIVPLVVASSSSGGGSIIASNGGSALLGLATSDAIVAGAAGVDISYQLGITFMLLGFLAAITGPNVRSVLQNVSSPDARGTAFAIFTMSDDIGRGGGPYLIAIMIKHFGGRRKAFFLGSFSWLLCGILLCLMYFTLVSDELAVRERHSRILGKNGKK